MTTNAGVAFLAEAGRVLGASLDYRQTLQGLSELGLGIFGEACLVGLVDDGGRLRIVAGAHTGPDKRTIVAALRDVTLTRCSQISTVVRTGRSCVLPAIDVERLEGMLDPDALARGRSRERRTLRPRRR